MSILGELGLTAITRNSPTFLSAFVHLDVLSQTPHPQSPDEPCGPKFAYVLQCFAVTLGQDSNLIKGCDPQLELETFFSAKVLISV